MARKKSTSRPNIPQETLNRARQQAGQSPPVIEPDAPPRPRPAPRAEAPAKPAKSVTIEQLADEYAYVVTDLRNMALLAAALFAVLIVIALVL